MPRHPGAPLPPGYAVVRRAGGYYLQREAGADIWRDVAGPYTQRWAAVQRAEREAQRMAEHEQWPEAEMVESGAARARPIPTPSEFMATGAPPAPIHWRNPDYGTELRLEFKRDRISGDATPLRLVGWLGDEPDRLPFLHMVLSSRRPGGRVWTRALGAHRERDWAEGAIEEAEQIAAILGCVRDA